MILYHKVIDMSYEKECEERVMLTREQYNTLLLHFIKERKYIRMINNYLDTPRFTIRKHGASLRIRDYGQEPLELTLKIKGSNGDTEVTQMITYEQENLIFSSHRLISGEVKKNLAKLNVSSPIINKWGYNSVERLEVVQDNYKIVLDRNQIRNVVDYDLEIESPSMDISKKAILKICSEFNIEYSSKYLSKSKRTYLLYKFN